MIFIEEKIGDFSAPIEKVWERVISPIEDSANEIHPDLSNYRAQWITSSTVLQAWTPAVDTANARGKTNISRARMKMTVIYPLGVVYKALSGSLQGSKFFNYLRPAGNKTGYVIVGGFESPYIKEESKLRDVALGVVREDFETKEKYLAKTISQ